MILRSSAADFLTMHCHALSFGWRGATTWNSQLWDVTRHVKQRAVDVRVKAVWLWVSRWKQIALANAWAFSMPLVLQMSNDTKQCRFRGCECSQSLSSPHLWNVIHCGWNKPLCTKHRKILKGFKRDPCVSVGNHWVCLAPVRWCFVLPTLLYLVPKVSMYGGAPKWEQVNKYRQGVHSIIACPGRLNDLLDGRQVQVSWRPGGFLTVGECWRFQQGLWQSAYLRWSASGLFFAWV